MKTGVQTESKSEHQYRTKRESFYIIHHTIFAFSQEFHSYHRHSACDVAVLQRKYRQHTTKTCVVLQVSITTHGT